MSNRYKNGSHYEIISAPLSYTTRQSTRIVLPPSCFGLILKE